MIAELLIVLLLCAGCAHAIYRGGETQRLAAAAVAGPLLVYLLSNDVFAILLGACGGYALWKGGAPERLSAAVFIFAVILTHYAGSSLGPERWTTVEVGILAVDLAALTAWSVIAFRAERFWPIWFTAMHIVCVAGHAIKMVDPELLRWGYAFAIAAWSYPMIFILGGATWLHRRRLALRGGDPDWTSPRRGAEAAAQRLAA